MSHILKGRTRGVGSLNVKKKIQHNPALDNRQKVIYAALHLDGETDTWYQSTQLEEIDILWTEFARLVCHRFTKGGYEKLEGQFNKLQQRGRVDEYITQFEELKKHMMVQNPSLSELYFVNSFLSGLKDEISSTLYLHKPSSLKDARDKARAQECVIEAMEKRPKTVSKPGGL